MSASSPESARPLSVTDMFTIGVGPSSSHTVGPMRAARDFAAEVLAAGVHPARVVVELCGSLGSTGRGHGTDRAVVWGLAGYHPRTCPDHVIAHLVEEVRACGRLTVGGALPGTGGVPVRFHPDTDVLLLPREWRGHVNALTLRALDDDGAQRLARTYFSVGGGFVTKLDESGAQHPLMEVGRVLSHGGPVAVPHPFSNGAEMLARCRETGMGVAELVRANEEALRGPAELDAGLDEIWAAMDACITAGLTGEGLLPGGLHVPRRAGRLYAGLTNSATQDAAERDPLIVMDWVNLFALAVNEENAAGRRVVTAPTNGAAGVIPAVLKYYTRFVPGADQAGVRRFLLAATAIGAIIKTNASIAGAEVGCQGEVGSASAMAAAGLAEVTGCSPAQVENAAEIAMEHNLGLTCDPIGGLVQIPCIERNAVAAVKSINAARIAAWGDGKHTVSLDAVVETMRQTGRDMMSKYKETALGGLAVNVVEC